MNTTRYYDLTNDQKLALSGEAISDSIKLEAIHRNIKIPVTLSGLIEQHGFTGFTTPADSVTFYEVYGPGSYSGITETGLAYKTEAEAQKAIQGAVLIYEDGYGSEKIAKLRQGDFGYRARSISLTKTKSFASMLETYCQDEDDTAFQELSDEIRKELNELWQARYNKQVNWERRAEYIRLANGDEAVARAFWARSEKSEWPEVA